ncbi:MAG TPA: hypothetical protein VGE62_02670 [Candidatus Paceibacterota bacterium]
MSAALVGLCFTAQAGDRYSTGPPHIAVDLNELVIQPEQGNTAFFDPWSDDVMLCGSQEPALLQSAACLQAVLVIRIGGNYDSAALLLRDHEMEGTPALSACRETVVAERHIHFVQLHHAGDTAPYGARETVAAGVVMPS